MVIMVNTFLQFKDKEARVWCIWVGHCLGCPHFILECQFEPYILLLHLGPKKRIAKCLASATQMGDLDIAASWLCGCVDILEGNQ